MIFYMAYQFPDFMRVRGSHRSHKLKNCPERCYFSILPVFCADFGKIWLMIVPPKLKSERPTKPAGLSAEASAHWDAIMPEVEQKCILYGFHDTLMEILCESFAIYEKCRVVYRD